MDGVSIGRDFIREKIDGDIKEGKNGGKVVTRFPPEPNGYLHIGHAKSICLNFGIAAEYGGRCHLRFDDTNPETEDVEYVNAIMEDVRWLGFDWGKHLYYASDYYEQLYLFAEELIKKGKAYVCDLTPEQFKEYRGVPTMPGKNPPRRDTPPSENLELFRRMKNGEFEEGRYVLRAKIDMSSPNIHMRDPVIYRVKKIPHHRRGNTWCVYPMYDFAHCLSDAIEGITHSICTLEFEVHRPLYDWIIDQLDLPCHPQQIEFARLNLSYTVMSKRKMLELVRNKLVDGWDDPRLPTIRGLRRRGYTPSAIREFCRRIGVTKYDGITDISLLEFCIRDELNKTAQRVMAVFSPLKLVIDNYDENLIEELDALNNPEDPSAGTRKVPFGRELFIEEDDFSLNPPKGYYRMAKGMEVRLKYAYIVKCTEAVVDPTTGKVKEVHCIYDPNTRGGDTPDGRKVKGTIHWVSAKHAVPLKTRLYDRLFTKEDPDDAPEGYDYKYNLNPRSLENIVVYAESSLCKALPEGRYQFERKGYFYCDPYDSKENNPVFNQIVSLKDTWAKKVQKST